MVSVNRMAKSKPVSEERGAEQHRTVMESDERVGPSPQV